MKDTRFCFLVPFLLAVANPAFGGQPDLGRLDLREVTDVLTKSLFRLSHETSMFWQADDGLPVPQHEEFAESAARFITQYPVTPAHDHGTSLWDVDKTASRQLKCLTYLATGNKRKRREVAHLCATQAMRLQWTFPIRAAQRRQPEQAFYAAVSSLVLTGSLVRDGAASNSAAYEVGMQWLRTGRGQLVTYGSKGNDGLRKVTAAVIAVTHPDSETTGFDMSDKAFFAPTRPGAARHA